MPALFLGHGSPMNAIEDNAWRRSWQALGQGLARPRAIVVVSAHWETEGAAVTGAARHETIHDFYGFPDALFDVRYPAPGDADLAARVSHLLAPEAVTIEPARGLDHGVWGVLAPMYPAADIPVVQLSLPMGLTPAQHLARARKLAPLRDEGVVIVGSGNIVHNLRYWRHAAPRFMAAWEIFNAAAIAKIKDGDTAALADYRALAPEAELSVPSEEHYLPLLYVMAAQQPGEPVEIFNDAGEGAIRMTSVIIGRPT